MRSAKPLTAKEVEKKTKPGRYADGLGLYLQVAPGGSKSWVFRFMRNGKSHKMGLGPVHTVSLAKARELATVARQKLLVEGVNPLEQRRTEKAARRADATRGMTFRLAAEKYIAAHKAGWKSDKHAAQWSATLEAYAYPVFGGLHVGKIDLPLVLKVLEPIWNEKTETASRVRGRIETILDWATARKLRAGENPARWKGHLDKLLPARRKVQKVKHHSALPYVEIGAFISNLRKRDGVAARAFEFAILTAARTGEVIGARWDEIDIAGKLWVVPAERMKAERPHRVPLSGRALEILGALPREENNDFVFIGEGKGKGLSSMALLMTLRRMERSDLTAHGFRSTFRDWAAETTAYPNEMVEMALAHQIGSKTEAAYRRGDMMARRARLMDDWAKYCATRQATGSNVTPIKRGIS